MRLVVAALSMMATMITCAALAAESDGTVEVGKTGWEIKRPVLASACPHACPWGELGDFVVGAMAPLGYDVVLCRNCNRDRGPRLVATGSLPPPLDGLDAYVGTTTRVNAAPDFGVTAAGFLGNAFHGEYPNLRLIARIEDPTYLLVAVRTETGIKDLHDVEKNKMPVKILAGGGSAEVLGYYGLTREKIESWGGSFGRAMGARADVPFDIIIDSLGSSAMNPEASQWTSLSMAHDLTFLTLPDELLDELASTADYERVTLKWGYLRGVDRDMPTVGRTGEVIFARGDTPEASAYDVAKAIDTRRGELKWYVRPYSIDPRTVWHSQHVPLHPGAERFYREAGYIE